MSHIDPRGFDSVVEWSDRMKLLLDRESENFPRLDDPMEWQQWASGVFGDVDPIGQDAPDPFAYDDWKEWAQLLFLTHEF